MQSILVVEDDDFHRILLADGLRDYYSHEVLVAESAQKAIELIEKRSFEVLIVDMHLEDSQAGFRLIRFVKSLRPRTVVVVTTPYATVELVTHWMRAGAADVICKPFTFEGITKVIRRALDLASTAIDRDSLIERLIVEEWELVGTSKSAGERGTALENFCSLLFRTIPGWSQIESRLVLQSEELDLVISNESRDVFWREYGSIILAECKNWHRKKKPGRADFDAFLMKLQRRAPADCRLGFFVSTNGFTRAFVEEARRILRDPQVIVPLELSDLWSLVVTSDRSDLLKDYVRRAVMGAGHSSTRKLTTPRNVTPDTGPQADG